MKDLKEISIFILSIMLLSSSLIILEGYKKEKNKRLEAEYVLQDYLKRIKTDTINYETTKH